MAPHPLVAGNWKMNGLLASLDEVRKLKAALGANSPRCEVLICPPATLIAPAAEVIKGSAIGLGGQDCHAAPSGAHTGDVSAAMFMDLGCAYVIVGHSERRTNHGERDEDVRAKAEAAIGAGLAAIICIGETEAERDAGRTLAVIERQLEGSIPQRATPQSTVIAYEPVWAIGTGRTPTEDQVAEVHDFIRERLKLRFVGAGGEFRILYGGSVKPANARSLMAVSNVNGALVGGASLKAEDFGGIIAAYE